MRKRFIAVFFALFTVSCTLMLPSVNAADLVENTWETMTPLPIALSGEVCVVDGKIYAINGNYNFMYNPATNTWISKTPMPSGMYQFSIGVYNKKVYCIGIDPNGRETNEVYDTEKDTWTKLEPAPTPRFNLHAKVVNGKIYLIGGKTENQLPTTLNEAYDIATNTWLTKTSMLMPSEGYTSVIINSTIYIIGGYFFNDKAIPWIETSTNKIQIYDCQNDSWRYGASLPADQWAASAVATTGTYAPQKIYVIGKNTWVYNLENSSWVQGATMPTDRIYMGLAVVDDLLYTIGGASRSGNGTLFIANERYVPFGYDAKQQEDSNNDNFEPIITVAGIAVAAVIITATIILVYHYKVKTLDKAKP